MKTRNRGLGRIAQLVLKKPLGSLARHSWPVPPARDQKIEPSELVDSVLAATARSSSLSLACEARGGYDPDTVHHHLRKLSPASALTFAKAANQEILRQARAKGLLFPATGRRAGYTQGSFRLTTTLILYWRPDKNSKKSVCFPFVTSERELTPERAHELAYLYLDRWHIETGYQIKNKLRVRTCSPHARLRRFLQYFSILAHNLWILHRWLARKLREKTTVTVRLFQVVLEHLVIESAA